MALEFLNLFRQASSLCAQALDELAPHESAGAFKAAVAAGWRPDDPNLYCPRCGANSRPTAVIDHKGCRLCRDRRFVWSSVTRVGPYAEPLDQWIRQMKFQRAWTWGERLGELLADGMRPRIEGVRAAVCPVPMHWRRRRVRGFNQSQILARTASRRLKVPMIQVLYRTRYSQPQSAVPDSQRRINVARVFAVQPVDLTGWEIWLVDDVKTSGATLTRCTKLLRQQGADRVHLAVVAAAQSRQTRFLRSPVSGSASSAVEAEPLPADA